MKVRTTGGFVGEWRQASPRNRAFAGGARSCDSMQCYVMANMPIMLFSGLTARVSTSILRLCMKFVLEQPKATDGKC